MLEKFGFRVEKVNIEKLNKKNDYITDILTLQPSVFNLDLSKCCSGI